MSIVQAGTERGGVLAFNGTAIITPGGARMMVDGGIAPIVMGGQLVGGVIAFQDVTERELLSEQIQRAQRLRSVELMAGGMAHDFKNIFSAIHLNIDLARQDAVGKGAIRLDEAIKAVERANELTQTLSALARAGSPSKEHADVAPMVRNAAEVAMGSGEGLVFHMEPDIWKVEVDRSQMGQVISNLVLNAHQAMSGSGIVMLSVANVHTVSEDGLPIKEGRYVRITVTDNGMGIPQDKLRLIFEPYYTTKPFGTGLGLVIAQSVVLAHQGYISVESTPGKGTAMSVYIPAFFDAVGPAQ